MKQPTPHQVLIQRFVELHPEEVALQLDDVGADEAVGVLQREDAASAAKVLQRMELDRGSRHFGAHWATRPWVCFLKQLDEAVTARLLAQLDEAARARILALAGAERGREIREILSYPPGTAGSLMDAQVNTFAVDCAVGTALERVRQLGNRRAMALVLRDENGRYAGVVRLPDVVAADPELLLGELRDDTAVQVQPMTPREEVVELLNTYRLTSLPVVDFQGQVVGIIRHDGLVNAAQQDLAANVQEMVGASAEERAHVQAVGGHSQSAALAPHQPRNRLSGGCGRRPLRGHDCQVYRARGLATRSRGSVGQYRRAGPRRDYAGTRAARDPHLARDPRPRQGG